MSAIWFNSMTECIRNAPGEWGRPDGYIYGVFFTDGEIKVGSSVNPRLRLLESFSNYRAKVAVSYVGKDHLKRELDFHHAMRGLNVARRREHYWPKDEPLRSLIVEYVESGGCPAVLKRVAKRAGQVISDMEDEDYDPAKAPQEFRCAMDDETFRRLDDLVAAGYCDQRYEVIYKLIDAAWLKLPKAKRTANRPGCKPEPLAHSDKAA